MTNLCGTIRKAWRILAAIVIVSLAQSCVFAQTKKHSDWVEDDTDIGAPQPQQQNVGDLAVPRRAQPQAPLPQYAPSSQYQQMYNRYFANDRVDDEDADDDTVFGGISRRPMRGQNTYNNYNSGGFVTPFSSGTFGGTQQGFGAPLYAGTEFPNPMPYFQGGFGRPMVNPYVPYTYSPYGASPYAVNSPYLLNSPYAPYGQYPGAGYPMASPYVNANPYYRNGFLGMPGFNGLVPQPSVGVYQMKKK